MIKILLVEDDAGDVFMLREVIDESKFENELFVTHNGVEALKFLKDPANPKVDFIITDINMPRMNGHEFLEDVSKDDALKKIPIAVLTNSQDTENCIKSYGLNATICLFKPLNQSKITDIVKSIERFWLKNTSIKT